MKNKITTRPIALALILITLTIFATSARADLDSWLSQEYTVAHQRLLQNISPSDGVPGAVIASPSRENPNYYYHWTRDAALVMDAFVTLYRFSEDHRSKEFYRRMLFDYMNFSLRNQRTTTLSGLGEPKFNVDGTAFNEPWGRPQDDGPALRAITLIRFAFALQAERRPIPPELYDALMPANSVIKADLEYISNNWQNTSYDLWEEVKGHHFYTRMVQRRALIEGAQLARALGDTAASTWYEQNARALSQDIQEHWDPVQGILVATLHRDGGIDYKESGLDAAVLLGVLHGYTHDGFMDLTDDKVVATVNRLIDNFQNLYAINGDRSIGPALGRYPEDRYYGGNPWVLITLAAAEYFLRSARILEERGAWSLSTATRDLYKGVSYSAVTRQKNPSIFSSDQDLEDVIRNLRNRALRLFARVQLHANPDGSLSEQMHRDSGMMESARDLSWNYAGFITAFWAK